MLTEVRLHQGRPTLFINGQPHHGFMSSAPQAFVGDVQGAGFDIIDTHPQTPTGWIGDEHYDYAATDARVESYLQQCKSELLIIRFWLGYPEGPGSRGVFWWAAAHPEESIAPWPTEPGQPMPWDELAAKHTWGDLIAMNEGRAIPPTPRTHPARPSYASQRFRTEAGEALRRVIAHLEERFGDRIAGYVIGGGPCGEWFHWHADEARMVDYSMPMVRAYRAHLQHKYETIAALNIAWNSRHRDFSAIALPTPAQRFLPSHGHLRSATAERATLDFYEAYSGVLRDTLLYWAGKAKEGCGRNKITMVFYGYLWNHNYGDSQARAGHACLQAILNSRDVDAVVAPFCYSLRQLEGVMTGQGLAASVQRHGKLYVHELDGGTHLLPCWNSPHHHTPQNAEESGQLLRRELTKMLTEGSAGWFMDLRGGYFHHADVIAELRKTLEHGKRLRGQTGRSNAQVAVVLDPRTPFFFREGEPLLSPLIDAFKQFELARMGLGFEDLSLDDLCTLSPEQTAQYKFWIFPSAVHLTAEQQRAIRMHACRQGNHVLWNYAVNVCGGATVDLDGMERMTGFRCSCRMDPGELAVRVEPGNHPWLADLAAPLVFGTRGDLSPKEIAYHAVLGQYATEARGFRISPRFFIQDGGEPLGSLPDLPGNPCGLAVRAMEGWTSVLSCAPLMPRVLLRAIARSAGCHVYTDFPCQVMQCAGYVGLFFHADGPCTIALPHRVTKVIEHYTSQVVGSDCDRVTLQARRNQCVLLEMQR